MLDTERQRSVRRTDSSGRGGAGREVLLGLSNGNPPGDYSSPLRAFSLITSLTLQPFSTDPPKMLQHPNTPALHKAPTFHQGSNAPTLLQHDNAPNVPPMLQHAHTPPTLHQCSNVPTPLQRSSAPSSSNAPPLLQRFTNSAIF